MARLQYIREKQLSQAEEERHIHYRPYCSDCLKGKVQGLGENKKKKVYLGKFE